MKTKKRFIVPAMLALFAFTGCIKSGGDDFDCSKVSKIKIKDAKSLYYVGDTIQLRTDAFSEVYYSWHQSNALNEISSNNKVVIYSCTKNDEGWYWLTTSNPGCDTHIDSVYIQVINKEVTPPCSPTNNAVSFSLLPGISVSTSWGMHPSWNCKDLSGYQAYGYPDIDVYFNTYWNDKEPENGEYSIASTLTFPDNNVYTVFVTSLYSSIYFSATSGKVYVTHVNGKIQVTFCDLTLSGDSYKTTAAGKLTAP